MEQQAPADRLDPAVKRDLFFGDWAVTRREIVSAIVATLVTLLLVLAGILAGGAWSHLAIVNCWIAFCWGAIIAKRPRREEGASTRRFRNPLDELKRPRMAETLEALRAEAVNDPVLAVDPRLATETGHIRPIRTCSRAVVLLQTGALLTIWVVLVQQTVVDVRAALRPTTVELVDVVLVQGADFQGPTTIDLTGGRVSQIGPPGPHRVTDYRSFRSFEALGKYLVAGGSIDLSQPDWFARFRSSWVRPLALGTTGDFVVVDADPRFHDLSAAQVAAAVVGGRYYSREDLANVRH